MISIIDYGVGNISAFQNVYKRLDIPCRIARSVDDLQEVERLILPGVGHFDYAMNQLNRSGMRERIDHLVLIEKKPVIGICVGMQMMAERSQEGKETGLGWINAEVKKFDESKIQQVTRLPHMGWNDVVPCPEHPLFIGLEKEAIFYFLHSFYFEVFNSGDSIATSHYGIDFTCAVNHQNIYGIQFHPEKSHSYGERLLKNFATL